jgi:glycosyltransferase involved in cell wall biosynthesis
MLSQFYPPIIGGEETHVSTLSRALAARGHHVCVVTLWNEGLPKFELDQGVRVYRIRGTLQRAEWIFKEAERRHVPPFPDPELVEQLRRVILIERPEIVHSHNWLGRSFLPLKAWSKARFVVSLHDYNLRCAKKSLLYHESTCSGPGFIKCLNCAGKHYGKVKGFVTTLSNWVMSAGERALVDMFIPVSQATATGNGLVNSGRPYCVIPNFLTELPAVPGDRERFETYLAQLPQEPFLLYVGDLRRFKGIKVLLKAYESLNDPPPLVLIGRTCEDTPAELPGNVFNLGRWPHGAVMEAWKRSLLGLLPSIGPETFGIAALEAMSMGRPVIAARSGGLAEVVADGKTGLLVPPGDAVALGESIEYLVKHSEIREQMGQAAREHAFQFSTDLIVPRIEQVYRKLLSRQAMLLPPVAPEVG